MNRKDLFNGFSEIDDDILERSEEAKKMRMNVKWKRWGSMAAVFILIICTVIPVIYQRNKIDIDDSSLDDIAPFIYNNCYYEVVDDPKILEKYGLPRKITADMAGDHVAYIDINFDNGFATYIQTSEKTNIELYVYGPAPTSAVYVYRDGEDYMSAIFCNYVIDSNSNTTHNLSELYQLYGVLSDADIASIAEDDWQNDKVIGSTITNRKEIEEFFDMTVSLDCFGNDEFQKQTFGNIPEERQQQAHTEFADNLRNLRIETTSGLRFYISLYPDYDWIYGGGTMSYFRINEKLCEWIDRNLYNY